MPNFLGALPLTVGARRRHPHGHQMSHKMQAAYNRAQQAAQFANPDLPGTPARDAAILPAAFPVFLFALATGVNIIQQTMNPQVAFRGQRLTAVVIRNGASATTSAPLLSLLLIGQKPIITTANGIALEVFNQNAFDTNLIMPPTLPGVIYTANINLTAALTTTDTITCLVAILGSSVL